MSLAPIILFVYNRPLHTQQTVEALQKNEFSKESELFIYSDAPKNEDVIDQVGKVREYIKKVDGFKKITIIEREKNWGLADSIIDGVTFVVNQYGKVIVLEDDLVTSPYFLKFMNDALEFYKDEKKVWHISGWNYPINSFGLEDTFLWRVMNCWGWATWKDRWKYFEKDTEKLIKNFTNHDIKRFNLDGSENFWGQVLDNSNKKINTWAIYWYATIFQTDGLCLNPTVSFVENIGLDGSGIHCGESKKHSTRIATKYNITFTKNFRENKKALKRIKFFYGYSMVKNFKNNIKKLLRAIKKVFFR